PDALGGARRDAARGRVPVDRPRADDGHGLALERHAERLRRRGVVVDVPRAGGGQELRRRARREVGRVVRARVGLDGGGGRAVRELRGVERGGGRDPRDGGGREEREDRPAARRRPHSQPSLRPSHAPTGRYATRMAASHAAPATPRAAAMTKKGEPGIRSWSHSVHACGITSGYRHTETASCWSPVVAPPTSRT